MRQRNMYLYGCHFYKKRFNELTKGRDEYLTLVENTPDIITRWDKNLKLLYANAAFEAKTGAVAGSLLGKTAFEMGDSETFAVPYADSLQKAFNEGVMVEYYNSNPGVIEEGIFDIFKRVVETGVPDFAERHHTHEQFNDWVIDQVEMDLEVMIADKRVINRADLPTIEASKLLIYQLFYNLILNALKFSKQGEASIINITASDTVVDERDYIKIIIADNGIGFKQEQSDIIFNTFTRLNAGDRYEGTGLGLALCKKIVERYDGTISAGGEPNKGAVFTILFHDQRVKLKSNDMKYKILLIDDDVDDRLFSRDAVKQVSSGEVACITLEDGHEMLAALTGKGEERPSIIFLDVNMPTMNGWECIALLKESEIYKDIPVVMYSTSKYTEEILRAKAAGAICFFNKPYNFNVLKQAVSDVIEHIQKGELHELCNNSKLF